MVFTVAILLSIIDILAFICVCNKIKDMPLWPFLPGGGILAFIRYFDRKDYMNGCSF